MSKIRFQILPPIAHREEPVFVTGSLPALGDWEPDRGLRLEWKPPYHTGEIEVETGVHFEYKIVRGSWEAEAVDAYGDVPSNLAHEVWLDATLHHTVADWKDRYLGRLTRETVSSRVLAGTRELMIWLPHSYVTDAQRRFPLIVLHDGANVFDPQTSPLSGVDWAADEWVNLLSHEGVMPEAIVVGVCHPEGFSDGNETLRDYDLSPELGGAAYAEFLIEELVPHMDAHYRTLAEAAARMLGGASLGGLISFYVAIHHPGIFGGFVCLSTAFEDVSESLPGAAGQLRALADLPALPAGERIYFDYGTQGLDECYDPYHRELGGLLREKGWHEGREFQIVRVEGGGHSELSWRTGFGEALRFLAQ
jgi:enterochelin esterase-like enzyme